MKLVKGLQKWIEGYNDVKTLTDELELAFDFYKDELVTEQEVDEAYAKALEHVENLELQNMLRDEADQMSCVLKINSGAGGTESQDWASMLMRMYLRYAETMVIKQPWPTCRKVMKRVLKLVPYRLKATMPTGI